MADTLEQLLDFFAIEDENGLSNLDKVHKYQKVLRRVATTDQSKSVEAAEAGSKEGDLPNGIILQDGKIVGLGIHIFNEDVYPLKSFEINLRNCDLIGELNVSGCRDMVFLDLYHNRITAVKAGDMPAMRIFGVQDNLLTELDVTEMPACQGIDAGMNRLTAIDVSKNPELVELYINHNRFTEIDLSHNPKLKYFYCHNNGIRKLDTRQNPLLRHLNATGNPLREILSLAPQREERLPLELRAGEGGAVGLHFYPVYNAQWKETGEWRQSYHAYPEPGHRFVCWQDEEGRTLSREPEWIDGYGASRILKACFAADSE